MRQSPQNRRLAEAVAALAATITEIIDERVREQASVETPGRVVEPAAEPFVTKQEFAERMREFRWARSVAG